MDHSVKLTNARSIKCMACGQLDYNDCRVRFHYRWATENKSCSKQVLLVSTVLVQRLAGVGNKTASKDCKMNRNLRWSTGMIALLLATFACTNQADAQSTYLPPSQSFNEYQSFSGVVVTAPQLNHSTIYSPPSYAPPTSTLYSDQPQPSNSFWTPQLTTPTNSYSAPQLTSTNSYSAPQATTYQRTLYPQKTIANPFAYHSNTAQTPACQGGS